MEPLLDKTSNSTNIRPLRPLRRITLTPSDMPLKPAPQENRTFFLTIVTANRRPIFQNETSAHLLLDLFAQDRAKSRYLLHAFVIMPDHLHLLITPAAEISLEKAIQFIKGGFSFRLQSRLEVWQKGHNEHRITDAADYDHHLAYIHENPARAHLHPDYPYTSAKLHGRADPAPSHLTRS